MAISTPRQAQEDDDNGTRGLPWLTPSLTPKDKSLRWTSSANTLVVSAYTSLSFCPGSILNGVVQPFLVGPRLPKSHLCKGIYVSIANSRVFHLALHNGSDTGKEYGLHTFPETVLRQLEACQDATWMEAFRLIPTSGTFSAGAGEILKNFSFRFGAHRDFICGTSLGSRVGPLTPFAPVAVRAAQAAALTHRHPRPPILDEAFSAYETAMANLPEEPAPVKLQTLKAPQHSPEDMDAETTEPGLEPIAPQTGGAPGPIPPPKQE